MCGIMVDRSRDATAQATYLSPSPPFFLDLLSSYMILLAYLSLSFSLFLFLYLSLGVGLSQGSGGRTCYTHLHILLLLITSFYTSSYPFHRYCAPAPHRLLPSTSPVACSIVTRRIVSHGAKGRSLSDPLFLFSVFLAPPSSICLLPSHPTQKH
ncbi:hypothetical protein BC567DRAFT_25786 [Phyllosticta citribraziliensis]